MGPRLAHSHTRLVLSFGTGCTGNTGRLTFVDRTPLPFLDSILAFAPDASITESDSVCASTERHRPTLCKCGGTTAHRTAHTESQMIGRLAAGPLSPPNSPRMSDIHGKSDGLQWDQSAGADLSVQAIQLPPSSEISAHNKNPQSRPSLRSIKSFPYSLGPSSRIQHDSNGGNTNNATNGFQERVLSQGPQPTASSDLPQPTFGGSAPTSPVERLTPKSQEATATGGQDDAPLEDEEMDLEGGEQEEEGERPPMTAAELRAHKRKMKRFR